ncbi:MAG: glutamate racemase [Kordiimonas sp.]
MIGVFDSGSGGVTILDALHKRLPDQDFLYLGDHANAPYGHRSNEQIVELTRSGVDTLMKAGCSLVVLACNTAAAIALRTLQQNWLSEAHPNARILGVLVPMVEALTGIPWSQQHPNEEDHPTENITLFATKKTVESDAFKDEIEKRAPHLNLTGKACPGLVDAIEGGAGPLPIRGLIDGYVKETNSVQTDAVILGCTHFPLVKEYFEEALKPATPIFSQPEIVANSLADYLERHPNFCTKGAGKVRLLTSGKPADVTAANKFLPKNLRQFEKSS